MSIRPMSGSPSSPSGAYQPVDSDLTAIAALTTTAYGRALLALADAAALRTAAGLGTAATSASTDFQPIDSDLTAIAALTTTAFGRAFLAMADAAAAKTALALAKADVGLGSVDNTADTAKPVSTAQQTALNLKADLASPALTGSPTAPTQTARDNSTKLATTAYVDRGAVINTQTGTSYTVVLADGIGTTVEMNNASANTFTIPPNSSVAFPVGTIIGLRQYGAGQTTVTPGAGVTIRSRGTALKTAGQYAEASLMQRAADEWVLTGDVTT